MQKEQGEQREKRRDKVLPIRCGKEKVKISRAECKVHNVFISLRA